ncbi:MAG: hypothetical protein ACLUU0_11670 [Anaerostipes hadrus]
MTTMNYKPYIVKIALILMEKDDRITDEKAIDVICNIFKEEIDPDYKPTDQDRKAMKEMLQELKK